MLSVEFIPSEVVPEVVGAGAVAPRGGIENPVPAGCGLVEYPIDVEEGVLPLLRPLPEPMLEPGVPGALRT